MKTYLGTYDKEEHDWHIVVNENNETKPLDPRFDLRNHSPCGFAWGYGGSGPAQTAVAILADVFNINSEEELLRYNYQEFKWQKIATIPMESDFMMNSDEIHDWVEMRSK